MGAGKTTIGRELARRLGWEHVDTDAVLAERHGPIARQIRDEGEAVFRSRERQVVAALAAPGRVLSTGGGVFADPTLRQTLRQHAWLVTLDVDLDTVRDRVGDDPARPLLAHAEALLAERAPEYADADVLVDGRLPVDTVVQRILDWLDVARDLTVDLGARRYPVLLRDRLDGLGRALRRTLGVDRVVLVTEDTVGPLWADAATASLTAAGVEVGGRVVLPAGEANKTLNTWSSAVDGLLSAGVDRRTPVVALGGGVLGDIAGFAAASVLRGVPFVQVPTTVLSMLDSSVGGKTGVNHDRGKNLLGAFHQPALVFAALDTLRTLDPRAARSGLAEVLKAALIGDADLLDLMEDRASQLADLDPAALAEVIPRAIAVKAAIVAQDEREAGIRAVLNLGHTAGHALETAAGHGVLHHGEAVALGLVAETVWAEGQGIAVRGLAERIAACVVALGLPSAGPTVSRARLFAALSLDKKRAAAMLRVPVCERPGHVRLVDVPLHRSAELLTHLAVTLK